MNIRSDSAKHISSMASYSFWSKLSALVINPPAPIKKNIDIYHISSSSRDDDIMPNLKAQAGANTPEKMTQVAPIVKPVVKSNKPPIIELIIFEDNY